MSRWPSAGAGAETAAGREERTSGVGPADVGSRPTCLLSRNLSAARLSGKVHALGRIAPYSPRRGGVGTVRICFGGKRGGKGGWGPRLWAVMLNLNGAGTRQNLGDPDCSIEWGGMRCEWMDMPRQERPTSELGLFFGFYFYCLHPLAPVLLYVLIYSKRKLSVHRKNLEAGLKGLGTGKQPAAAAERREESTKARTHDCRQHRADCGCPGATCRAPVISQEWTFT